MTTEQRERFERWMQALESGEFKQNRRALRSEDGNYYCCLGVGCEIASRDGVGKWKGIYFETDDDRTLAVLPPTIARFYGLEGRDPVVCIDGVTKPVSEFNDDGVSFPEIAKALREQYGA